MAKILLKNVNTLVTMVPGEKPLHNVDLLISGKKIEAIGPNLQIPEGARVRTIDGTNRVVYPGLVNTHHHLYQTLTRNLPKVQNAKLFDWLVGLYEVWRELTPEAVEVSTQVGLGELLLSGCTTTTDHFYVFPQSAPEEFLDVEIDTARRMGVRFHPTRGSMSRGKSCGGLPPDDVVQSPEAILKDCDRLIAKYHDPKPFAMCRIVLAPCSPFSVTTELMKETAAYARTKGVFLHTHLCETKDEESFTMQVLGKRPLAYMEECGWVGPDVWYAHGIYFNDDEIKRLAETGTGVAHCPGSNLRLGSGICKVPQLLREGVRVGLAVDGSASNDSSSMTREMQLALNVHRVGTGVDQMPPQDVLKIATTGGASILGQPEIGQLKPGMAADIAMYRLDRVEYAGAMHDPASAILFCGAGARADYTIVNGKVLVAKGKLVGLDEEALFARANEVAAKMVENAERKTGVSYR
ncbi:MAG TPA: 8-oxoguanine deaminase [Kiritimatiellia bacterium]|nr:8-oxoguanine deaminase [Kiritimatiellia bacterium]HNR94078.1 8-oxoguanine deaminase [Kiritimatiellia bacterium]HNS80032.1 8-oxoguanine deaminase [Kiritimatiellia bacterium]HPA77964.1 8-oxoguanine deaminase [Kiritimatiellia bacterium]HQQ03832.1 8-oxoguanine deaminase [Kiritimatiellia bacterium]